MGHKNHLGPLIAQRVDGGQSGLDASVVRDGRTIERDVEIGANQNALPLEISKILECLHDYDYPFLHRVGHIVASHGKSMAHDHTPLAMIQASTNNKGPREDRTGQSLLWLFDTLSASWRSLLMRPAMASLVMGGVAFRPSSSRLASG